VRLDGREVAAVEDGAVAVVAGDARGVDEGCGHADLPEGGADGRTAAPAAVSDRPGEVLAAV
jgi:hypothetical protein